MDPCLLHWQVYSVPLSHQRSPWALSLSLFFYTGVGVGIPAGLSSSVSSSEGLFRVTSLEDTVFQVLARSRLATVAGASCRDPVAKLAGVWLGPGARLLVCSLQWPERRTCPPPSQPRAGKKPGHLEPGSQPQGRVVLACSHWWGSSPLSPSSGSLAGRPLLVPGPCGLEWRLQGGQATLPGHSPFPAPARAVPAPPHPLG